MEKYSGYAQNEVGPRRTRKASQTIGRAVTVTALGSLLASGFTLNPLIRAEGTIEDDDDLVVTAVADSRVNRVGMATIIRTGVQTYLFDCRGIDAVPAASLSNAPAAALFVSNVTWLTEPDIIRVLDSAAGQERLFRIWGPAGMREWMRRRYSETPTNRTSTVPTVAEIGGGVISEAGLRIIATTVAEGTLAYRIESARHSVLIASNVTAADPLERIASKVDLAVLRHSNSPEVLRFFDRVQPRELWVVPDGVPISMSEIRESYRGSFKVVTARFSRAFGPLNAAHELGR